MHEVISWVSEPGCVRREGAVTTVDTFHYIGTNCFGTAISPAATPFPLVCSFVKPFDESRKDEFACEEEGFAEALDDAIAAIDLPTEDRGHLVVVIPSDKEDDSAMEYQDTENVTPESTKEGRKREKAKSKRKKRAYIADDSEDEGAKPVSNTIRVSDVTVVTSI